MCLSERIHIPDRVEEICDVCFCNRSNLSRVTFGESSPLKWIAACVFAQTNLVQIGIPDSVEEIGDACFSNCTRPYRVTFGKSPSSKKIRVALFTQACLKEIIPTGDREIISRTLTRYSHLFVFT